MAQRGRPRKIEPQPPTSSDSRHEFYCSRCGRSYPVQRGNFPYSQSPLYAGNNHYATICSACLDELYEFYTKTLGSEMEAMRRICSKIDMYFSMDAYAMTNKASMESSRVGMYTSRLALKQFKGKTYDTTIAEGNTGQLSDNKQVVSDKTRKFFGSGFSDEDYLYLQEQYDDWISRYECQTKAQEEIFKNLAFAQLNILKAQRKGERVPEAQKALQELLKIQNITPSQRNDNTFAEQNTMGTLIHKFETEQPIMEPLPEWKDPDGIVRYITVYFLGHLCKMMGIKNRYSKMYEDEMQRYHVNRPEYEEDDEALFDAVFGGHIDGQ